MRRPDSSNVSLIAVIVRLVSCLLSKLPPGNTFKLFTISSLQSASDKDAHERRQTILIPDDDERAESHCGYLLQLAMLKVEER